MTYIPNWPSREEWEAQVRGIAAWMIETGLSHFDFEGGGPSFTNEESDEVAALLPVAVRQIRKVCGQVERAARLQSPTAAALRTRSNPRSADEVDAWLAPIDALQGDDKAAWDLLVTMRDIRCGLSSMHANRVDSIGVTRAHWPEGYARPSSPEIDRINALVTQAEERHREANREHGRRQLAEVNAPDAWERELERRAEIEDYFRRGGIVTRRHTV